MRVIVAGSRGICCYILVDRAIQKSGFTITEIVSGTAKGVDQLGELYACRNGYPVKKFPADWDAYGKSAGPIRNRQMAEYADAAIILWDGESHGTRNMIAEAKRCGLSLYLVTMPGSPPCMVQE